MIGYISFLFRYKITKARRTIIYDEKLIVKKKIHSLWGVFIYIYFSCISLGEKFIKRKGGGSRCLSVQGCVDDDRHVPEILQDFLSLDLAIA